MNYLVINIDYAMMLWFSYWALAHECYVVQVKARVRWINHGLESSKGEVYIVSCSAATFEGFYRDRNLKCVFFH